jgi:hypothetical protein
VSEVRCTIEMQRGGGATAGDGTHPPRSGALEPEASRVCQALGPTHLHRRVLQVCPT